MKLRCPLFVKGSITSSIQKQVLNSLLQVICASGVDWLILISILDVKM